MASETQDIEASYAKWKTQDSAPPRWTIRSLWTRYHVDGLWLTLYGVTNALVFWLRFRLYPVDSCASWAPAIAKGSAEVVMLNCTLSLLSVCHRMMDKLRGWASPSSTDHAFLAQRPLEMHREFHVLTGSVVLAMSLVHAVAWVCILDWSRTCDDRDWQNSALSTHTTQQLRETASVATVLHALPMWTGFALLIAVLVLLPFTIGRLRRAYFPTFERIHRIVLAPFVIILLFHGAVHWSSRLQAPLWLLPAIVVYVVERHRRLSLCTNATIVCAGATLSIGSTSTTSITTMRLFVTKTKRFLRSFEPGMFVYLQVPTISSLEWHPFSVCSSRDDTLMELQVRVVGDWTHKLGALVESTTRNHSHSHSLVPVAIPVRVDGPFGTPTVCYHNYDSVMLVAMGVGISPFVSVLRHHLHARRRHQRLQDGGAVLPTSRFPHFTIVWVVRDLALVEWLIETLDEFDDVVSRLSREELHLDVHVTTKTTEACPIHSRLQYTGGRRPDWSQVLGAWTPTARSAVFVSGSRAATSAIKHATASTRNVDVFAERFH